MFSRKKKEAVGNDQLVPKPTAAASLTQIGSGLTLTKDRHLGAAENEEAAEAIEAGQDPRRIVRIGFNLLSINTIEDSSNQFHCNFLIHVKWFNKGDEWHPWLQWKNAVDVSELENPGASRLGESTPQGWIVESTNVIGTFAKTLDQKSFPFDVQEISIVLVSNSTKDAVMSYFNPQAIKSNFEYEVLTEWIIVRDPENGQALSYFSFEGADPKLSAQGVAYNNFFFHILVARDPWAVTLATIIPSTLLALACLCCYSLDITGGPGDRFSVVFTVILTLIANQITSKDRLPILPYLTFIDWYLLLMQMTCYIVGVEAAFVSVYVRWYSKPGDEAKDSYYFDIRGFWVSFALLFGTFIFFLVKAYSSILYRRRLEREAIKKSRLCRVNLKKA